MTSSYRLILASVSPRRRQLLRRAGLRFETRAAPTDESTFPGLPARTVEYNSRIKAEAVSKIDPEAIVIGSDTVVFRREILGKPADRKEARRMLADLGGKSHSVFTGVTVIFPRPRETVTGSSESRVRFKTLDDETIDRYFSLVDPLDKAGAYAVQEHGELLIDRVEGSYSTVIGLPLECLLSILERHPGSGLPDAGLKRLVDELGNPFA